MHFDGFVAPALGARIKVLGYGRLPDELFNKPAEKILQKHFLVLAGEFWPNAI
jgi:hypothetical protein